MKTARERRKTPHTAIKVHIGSNVRMYHGDDKPIEITIDQIIPRGLGVYELQGQDVADGEYYSFVITR